MTSELDIVIPVYNEGRTIVRVLDSLRQHVTTPFRALICYDDEEDDTLTAVRSYQDRAFDITLVKNRGVGAHGAVVSGFQASTAPAVIVLPADDTHNAGIIDQMVQKCREGYDIVVASRLIPGGRMDGCPPLKYALVRLSAFTLHLFARVPTHDASNGFRLFSRRVLDTIAIESTEGFAYSIELLVKCHRLGWPICEIPAVWFERTTGQSRFRVMRWLPAYLRWYRYPFATTYLRRSPLTVTRTRPQGSRDAEYAGRRPAGAVHNH